MADILTFDQAKAALRIPANRPQDDALIMDVYVPATTLAIEARCGRFATSGATDVSVTVASGDVKWRTRDGVVEQYADLGIAYANGTLESVTSDAGTPVAEYDDYWGVIYGTLPGNLTVTLSWPAPPADVVRFAMRYLRQMWQADQQTRPQVGDAEQASTGWLSVNRGLPDRVRGGFA